MYTSAPEITLNFQFIQLNLALREASRNGPFTSLRNFGLGDNVFGPRVDHNH